MKITKQTIAAAAFAALLFAPLAQAQTSPSATANIDIVVINSGGMRIEAFDMSFGSIPSGVTDQSWILTCTADNNVGVVRDSTRKPAPNDDATCGVIKVFAGTDGFDYKLAVSADPLTGRTGAAVGSTLNPAFNIFMADGTTAIPGLDNIDSETGDPSRSDDAISISATSSKTYKMGGGIPIPGNQAIGDYAGTYTVMAEVQTP